MVKNDRKKESSDIPFALGRVYLQYQAKEELMSKSLSIGTERGRFTS
jgi:hypothetical protein